MRKTLTKIATVIGFIWIAWCLLSLVIGLVAGTYSALTAPTDTPTPTATPVPTATPRECDITEDPQLYLSLLLRGCAEIIHTEYTYGEVRAITHLVMVGPGANDFASSMIAYAPGENVKVRYENGGTEEWDGFTVQDPVVCTVYLPLYDVGVHVYGDPDLAQSQCEALETSFK